MYSIRPAVSDYASITAQHYRHAGEAGVEHLQFLINALIEDVDNLSVDELNLASACILHKSHGKDKSFADSYRTISSCPFLSKALDTYIGDIYGHIWEQHQAPTQFQGKGSSHDLAALLLTETIQSSLQAGNPIFVLYLDAKSAFDLVIRQYVTNKLYHYGIQDQGLFVIDQRLKNRKTICEWNGKYMGPIHDKWGVEQGGKNSSDFYKVYNNSQLQIAQDSLLGVDLGGNGDEDLTVSAIGQADDVALVSNDIFSLKCLLQLSLQYCDRHHVKLRADKTRHIPARIRTLKLIMQRLSILSVLKIKLSSFPMKLNTLVLCDPQQAMFPIYLRASLLTRSHLLVYCLLALQDHIVAIQQPLSGLITSMQPQSYYLA